MAQEYTVAHVESGVREWQHPSGGTIYYHKAYISGRDKPIEVGKKTPGAVKAGDVLYGDITPTEYPTDKFKAAQREQFGGGGGSGRPPARSAESREKEQEGMAWGNALTNATNIFNASGMAVAIKEASDLYKATDVVYELTKRLYESRKRYESGGGDNLPTEHDVDNGLNFEDIPF